MAERLNLELERYIINRFMSMPKLFDYLNIDYRVNANMYCPFHNNFDTPAAHLYIDENGYRLWCFAEHRMYSAWNIYKTFIPTINTNQLALMIYNKMTIEQQKQLIIDLGIENESNIIPYKQALIDFKSNKLNYEDFTKEIAKSYIDE